MQFSAALLTDYKGRVKKKKIQPNPKSSLQVFLIQLTIKLTQT